MEATYTKLRSGEWGIRVKGGTVRVGDGVDVRTKAGKVKLEIVERVLWSGDGVTLCAIKSRDERMADAAAALGCDLPRRRYYGRRSGAGQAASVPGYSSYCTGRMDCGCYDCAS